MTHGRLGYRRVAWMTCFYFYKNILLVFTEIYFAYFNGFSGQIFFADWLPMLFNFMWSSLTCLFAYSFERDVTEKWVDRYPVLYMAGQKKVYFSYAIFWKWVFFAWFHGIVVYVATTLGFTGAVDGSGRTEEMWFASTIAFSCIIHLVTIKLIIETIYFNYIVALAAIISVLVYWVMTICMNTNLLAPLIQPQIQNIYFWMFSNLKFWIVILGLPILATLPDLTLKYMKQIFWPTPTDKVMFKAMNSR
jgi:magnesium-transporting ATPase (P-type)